MKESNAPRILKCESDWKISPYGDADPDRDCYWVDTYEEALAEIESLNETLQSSQIGI
jgi:hypothetical protein